MTTDAPVNWPVFLREIDATEHAWNSRQVTYPRADAVPWMPFSVGQFVMLLTEAMTVTPMRDPGADLMTDIPHPGAPRFLDVGCGPGTKVRVAKAMFGVNGYGIDIVTRFVNEARIHGVNAAVVDAFDFPVGRSRSSGAPGGSALVAGSEWGYSDFDIVYVNRPSGLQDELEHLIMDRMAPDAILIAVNWRNDPGKSGWALQYQEYGDPVCGVYIKP